MMSRRNTCHFACQAGLIWLMTGLWAGTACALITATGNLSPGYNGTDDPWDVDGTLSVGRTDYGTLIITDGSSVSNTDGFIGYNTNAIGIVTVTGAGSAWYNSGELSVGKYANGTLNINDGGEVFVTGDTWVAYNRTGASGVIQFDGGVLNTTGLLASPNELSGVGTINAKSLVSDINLVFNAATGLQQQIVLNSLSGQNVTINLDASDPINLGSLGAGYRGVGSLRIADGQSLSSIDGVLGQNPGSMGTATVTGAGSVWNNTDHLYVGRFGNGVLNITDGGSVSNIRGYIGYFSDTAGIATVAGSGSTWNNLSDLSVGHSGNGTLNIYDGGEVIVAQHTWVGWDPDSSGTIQFANGTLNTTSLLASANNLLGIGTINTKGLVSDIDLVFDSVTGLQQQIVLNSLPGQDVTINLDASDTNNPGYLGAGFRNTGSLNITDSQSVASGVGILGRHPGSSGTATVTDANSTWNIADYLSVGTYGSGTLNITDGGTVSAYKSFVGGSLGSTGVATVSGAGSTWNNTERLIVGSVGNGTLNIMDGGSVSSGSVSFIGLSQDSMGEVTVTGAGSTWNHTGTLCVGGHNLLQLSYADGTGKLTISNGGLVSAQGVFIAGTSGSTGSATVTGADSMWDITDFLVVGGYGNGTLNLSDGGSVSTEASIIGYRSTGIATVSGLGSTWSNTDSLFIGGGSTSADGDGELTVSNNGLVEVDGTLKLWSTGTLTLDGGRIVTDTFDHTDGGVFNFNGGELSVVTFRGNLVQNGGTLTPGSSAGLTQISGDYLLGSAGTLEIEIGGITASTEYDRVEVAGIATLEGKLSVSLIDGFVPSAGDSFGFLFANGGFDGEFSMLDLPDISGQGLKWVVNPGAATLFLNVDQVLQGDLNNDGFVGLDDLDIVLSNWNQTVPPADPHADPSGDGYVGLDDLDIVLNNWNAGTPPVLTGTNIPEPVAGLVILLGLPSLVKRVKH